MIILFYRDSSHRNNKKISFSHPKSVPNLYVLTVAIDFHSMEKKYYKMTTVNSLVTNVLVQV